MAKMPAQHQKEYRERRKQRDESFLEKERTRVKGYRKPIHSLNQKDQAFVRERNRMYSNNYRERKRAEKQKKVRKTSIIEEQSSVVSSTSGETAAKSKRGQTTLLVKLAFPEKRRKKQKADALRREVESKD